MIQVIPTRCRIVEYLEAEPGNNFKVSPALVLTNARPHSTLTLMVFSPDGARVERDVPAGDGKQKRFWRWPSRTVDGIADRGLRLLHRAHTLLAAAGVLDEPGWREWSESTTALFTDVEHKEPA